MKFRTLGRSGLHVSALSYGNWITHGSQVAEDAAVACVNAALDAGITTFDTADIYAATRAESVLGRALAGQRREGLEIFTKVFWPTGPGRNDRGLGRKHIIESCNASLRRLGTDHIDLYQAHRFDHATPLEETLRAFDDLVRAGKVMHVGVSEWTAEQIRTGVELAQQMGLDRIISNQPQYSMLWRVIEAEVVPTSMELGIGQIIWSPLAQGVLTGKYRTGEEPPAGSRAAHEEGRTYLRDWLRDEVLGAVDRLRPVAEGHGISMAQLALAWALARPGVSSVIIGASRPQQIADNVAALDVTLDDATLAAIDEALGDVVERDPAKTDDASPRW